MGQTCPSCGTRNSDEIGFCAFCGAPLPGRPAETVAPARETTPTVTPRAPAPQPRSSPPPETRVHQPDFTGLFGIAFFLLVIGVVFFVNQNLLPQMGQWWDQIVAGRGLLRPPEGIITSGALFFALLGLTNFAMAALRWGVTRSKLRTIGAALGGVAMIAFAYLLYRYSRRDVSGAFILSVEAAVVGILLLIFIGSGVYWTTTGRRLAAQGTRTSR